MKSVLGTQNVLCASITRSPNFIFIKGEDYFLNQVPPDKNNCRGWNCHRPNERPLWKGLDESVASNLCPPLPLSATPGRDRRSFRSICSTGLAVTTLLESTQACFDFWQPHCVSVFSPKEDIIIIIAQIAVFFGNIARKESAKEW